MENDIPHELWALLLAAASAIVLLANAGKAIVSAWRAAKAPDVRQDERLDELERWRTGALATWQKEVDRKLSNDYEALQNIQGGLRASYQAQLALLDHGIDGNNVKQMQDAKEVLQKYLIEK